MLAHQKRFPMMHNNFVQKKKRKKQGKKSAFDLTMLLSAVMCANHYATAKWNCRIKLYINQIYVITIIHREFTLRKSYKNIYLLKNNNNNNNNKVKGLLKIESSDVLFTCPMN